MSASFVVGDDVNYRDAAPEGPLTGDNWSEIEEEHPDGLSSKILRGICETTLSDVVWRVG